MLSNEDIEAAVKMRDILVALDKPSVKAVLEFMLEWNKNRPAPTV